MSALTLRRHIAVFAFGLIPAAAALGQTPQTTTWEGVRSHVALRQKIDVVTSADPTQRQTCRVRSIDADEIVCAHHGHAIVFRAGDVAALIEPGKHADHFLDFLAAGVASMGAAGLFALVCPTCSLVAGVAALGFFFAAPVSAIHRHGHSADTLLYLAPGQALQVRLN